MKPIRWPVIAPPCAAPGGRVGEGRIIEEMTCARAGARSRLLTVVGLALYAAVLVASPFEHHDLVCHLKNPQHCTSCSSSQLGSDVLPLATPPACLADAGAAVAHDELLDGALLAVRSTGRSPPL